MQNRGHPHTTPTSQADAPRLPLKGRAAPALMDWLEAAQIVDGAVVRPVLLAVRALKCPPNPAAVRQILQARLTKAVLPAAGATPHGLRSTARRCKRLSLHRSVSQAMQYYADADLAENPASDLLG